MSTPPPQAWTCAVCGRSVPARVDECYCGRKRPAARPDRPLEKRPSRAPAVAIAIALVLAGAAGWYFLNRTSPPPAPPRPATEAAVSVPLPASTDPSVTAPVSDDVIKAAIDALVQVSAGDARGTGFFSAPGVITTSNGIVGNAKFATITLPDGRHFDATAIATADRFGLVQLRVAADARAWLPASPMRDARGAESLARLAWPQGATRGAVTGLRRDHGVELFQTDLPVHTEDDGAPLIDHTGRVVAVVSGNRTVAFDSARPYFR